MAGVTNRLIYFSGYFILLCLFAVFSGIQEANAEKDPTLTRLGQNVGSPTLKFLYWYLLFGIFGILAFAIF